MWITTEIGELAKLEERVNEEYNRASRENILYFPNFQITQDSDISNFMIELSGLLKELKSSYEVFTSEANINGRMHTVESRYLLLEFLISELMTQKMLLVTQKPKEKGNIITIVSQYLIVTS